MLCGDLKGKEIQNSEYLYMYIQIYIYTLIYVYWTSLVAQMVKNPPAIQETQVWSLDQEDPLEKGMATYSSILAWRIPWTEEPGRLQSMGFQRIGHDWETNTWLIHFAVQQETNIAL